MKRKNLFIKIFLLYSISVSSLSLAQQFEPATKIVTTAYTYVEPITQGEYRYDYKLESKSASEQEIWTFALEYGGKISKIKSPNGWDGGFFEGKEVINWSAGGDETPFDPRQPTKISSPYFIKPNTSFEGFGVEGNGIPGIVTYYSQGFTLPPVVLSEEEAPLDEEVPDFFHNSVKGKTIGPTAPPAVFKPLEFIDSIINMKHEAFNLGWIKNKGIVQSLDAKLDNAKKKLENGDTKAAKNILSAFIKEVEAQGCSTYENCPSGKHLTSEAYGLLKYNAQYLIDHL